MNDLRYSVMKDYAFESDRKKKTDIGKILFQIAFAKQELNYYIKDLEKIYSDFEEELDYINQHPIQCVPERQSIEAYRLEIQKLESLIDEKFNFIRNNTEKARIYFDEMGKDFRLFMKNHFDLLSSELDAISSLPQEEAVIIPDAEINTANNTGMEIEENNNSNNNNMNINLDLTQIPQSTSLSSSLPPSPLPTADSPPTTTNTTTTNEINQQQQRQSHHQQHQPILYDENKSLDENIKYLLTSKLKLPEDGDYCVCHYSGDGPMIGCDGECGNWYHKSCLGIDKVPTKAQWICPFCRLNREKKLEYEERENQERKQTIVNEEKGRV